MTPIALILVVALAAGLIFLLTRGESRTDHEPASVPLLGAADLRHGEPAMLVGELAPDEGLEAVEAPFGGGEVLYHRTRLERLEDAAKEDLPAAPPASAAPGGPGLGSLLGGALGGPGAGRGTTPAAPPPGAHKGVVAEQSHGAERWLLRDESGAALIVPFVSAKPPALRLQPGSCRTLQGVPLAEVQAMLRAEGVDPTQIPNLIPKDGSDGDEGGDLPDLFVIKQELLRVGERVLLAGRGQRVEQLAAEGVEQEEVQDELRRDQALRALSGRDASPSTILSGDPRRELFISNDGDEIARVARRALGRSRS